MTERTLAPWQRGYLDIHHISTGRGECAFMVLPDGTTLLVDAGELEHTERHVRHTAPRPSGDRPAYEWLARYIQRVHPQPETPRIDYAVLSHFHDDHLGMVSEASPVAECGAYRLAGLVGVGDALGIGTMLDRGYPDYGYPAVLDDIRVLAWLNEHPGPRHDFEVMAEAIENYAAFCGWQQAHRGMKLERFQAGTKEQIRLLNEPTQYPGFCVRNIAVNGQVWTGTDGETACHYPRPEEMTMPELLNENSYSAVMRIQYGRFSYYTGGDIAGNVDPGEPAWRDIETPVARAVGPVDVVKMNHHGNRSSSNSFFLRTLAPRVSLHSVWTSNHPGEEVLRRHISRHIYPGPRDLFSTDMHEANHMVVGALMDSAYASMHGHIVVRVAPGGESYRVLTVSDKDESMRVTGEFGPYEAGLVATERV